MWHNLCVFSCNFFFIFTSLLFTQLSTRHTHFPQLGNFFFFEILNNSLSITSSHFSYCFRLIRPVNHSGTTSSYSKNLLTAAIPGGDTPESRLLRFNTLTPYEILRFSSSRACMYEIRGIRQCRPRHQEAPPSTDPVTSSRLIHPESCSRNPQSTQITSGTLRTAQNAFSSSKKRTFHHENWPFSTRTHDAQHPKIPMTFALLCSP